MRNATIDRPCPSLSSCRATLRSEVVTRGRHGMAYASTVAKIGMLVETGVVPNAFVFRKAEEGHDNATSRFFKAFRRTHCRSLGSVVRSNFGSNSENAL